MVTAIYLGGAFLGIAFTLFIPAILLQWMLAVTGPWSEEPEEPNDTPNGTREKPVVRAEGSPAGVKPSAGRNGFNFRGRTRQAWVAVRWADDD